VRSFSFILAPHRHIIVWCLLLSLAIVVYPFPPPFVAVSTTHLPCIIHPPTLIMLSTAFSQQDYTDIVTASSSSICLLLLLVAPSTTRSCRLQFDNIAAVVLAATSSLLPNSNSLPHLECFDVAVPGVDTNNAGQLSHYCSSSSVVSFALVGLVNSADSLLMPWSCHCTSSPPPCHPTMKSFGSLFVLIDCLASG
jgi:hypothetical protein